MEVISRALDPSFSLFFWVLPESEFREKIDGDEFVEWVEVYPGRLYGTLRFEVERLWKQGKCVLFDIDVIGAMQIKEKYNDQCLAVFVQPPSVDVLIERLKKRKTETEKSLAIRKARFVEELAYASKFDRVLINDKLEMALKEAERITMQFLETEIRQIS